MYIRELESPGELPLVLLNAPRSCCRPTKHEQFRAVLNLRRTAQRLTVENSRLDRMNAMLVVLFQRLTGGVLPHQAVPVAGAFGQQQNQQPANAFAVPPVVPVVPVNANNNNRHSYNELQRELDTLTGTVDVLTEQNSRLAHTNGVLFGHVFRSVPPNVPPPFVPVAQAVPQHQPQNAAVALPHNVNPNPPGVFQPGQQLFDDNFVDAYLQNMDPN